MDLLLLTPLLFSKRKIMITTGQINKAIRKKTKIEIGKFIKINKNQTREQEVNEK